MTPRQERQLKSLVLKRASTELAKWKEARTDTERFYSLPHAAVAAFNLELHPLANQLSLETLELAGSFQDDWNYGNAIHYGHTVLGLLALLDENLQAAAQELQLSGATPGSPQLGSFGPTMQLAKALLKRGEFEPVLTYLKQCRTFWKMGGAWLDIWERKVKTGTIPVFLMHNYK